MKIFIIELDDLADKPKDAHKSFMDAIVSRRFEYWDYFVYQYVIATPDSYTIRDIYKIVQDSYGEHFPFVLFQADLRNCMGYGPGNFLSFFEILHHPNYIPVWEREGDDPYNPQHIINMQGIPLELKRRVLD